MQYYIRRAESEDMDRILDVYRYAREFMRKTGNPNQWGTNHPLQSVLEQDIRDGNLYVMLKDGKIQGVFAFILGEDPTYKVIESGNWHFNEPYGTIHRIAGIGGGGVFRSCVEFCGKMIDYIRVDTHHDNKVMQKTILKEGFSLCGVIYIADGTPRLAYDKKSGSTG